MESAWLPDPLGMFSDGRSMYYDRAGNPITIGRWMDLHGRHDPANYGYVVVAKTIVAGVVEVSTVWLGHDHGFGLGPPIIFETMVFEVAESYDHPYLPVYHRDLFDVQDRYSTEGQARAGHAAIVRELRDLYLPAVIEEAPTWRSCGSGSRASSRA